MTKVSLVKKRWQIIKNGLIQIYNKEIEIETKKDDWEYKNIRLTLWREKLEKSKNLPEQVKELKGSEIAELLSSIISSCDCPRLIGNYIITGQGEYVFEHMQELSKFLGGRNVDTWT